MSDLHTPTNVDYLLLTFELRHFYYITIFSTKFSGCGYSGGPNDLSVSPKSFFLENLFQLGGLLGQGLGLGLKPGLDKSKKDHLKMSKSMKGFRNFNKTFHLLLKNRFYDLNNNNKVYYLNNRSYHRQSLLVTETFVNFFKLSF